jgi:hypothetical protein
MSSALDFLVFIIWTPMEMPFGSGRDLRHLGRRRKGGGKADRKTGHKRKSPG